MAEFTPVNMKRKRDGAVRKVYSAADQISAEFDGFAAPAAKAPAAKKAAAPKATASKTAAKKAAATPTGSAVTDGATGK